MGLFSTTGSKNFISDSKKCSKYIILDNHTLIDYRYRTNNHGT